MRNFVVLPLVTFAGFALWNNSFAFAQEFREGVRELLEFAAGMPSAVMCSESVFWRCDRRLVADYLLVKGITVPHIMSSGELQPHTLTKGASVDVGELTYPQPDERADQPSLFPE